MRTLVRLGLCLMACFAVGSSAVEKSNAQPGPSTKCDKWEMPLSNQRKDQVVILVEEGCSGFTNVVTESIELVHSDGRRTVVLTYEDAGWDPDVHGHTTPTVNWITPDRLKISIGAVAAIHKKIARAGGVVIEYNIGRVLFK